MVFPFPCCLLRRSSLVFIHILFGMTHESCTLYGPPVAACTQPRLQPTNQFKQYRNSRGSCVVKRWHRMRLSRVLPFFPCCPLRRGSLLFIHTLLIKATFFTVTVGAQAPPTSDHTHAAKSVGGTSPVKVRVPLPPWEST